jgi:hypothetical protein
MNERLMLPARRVITPVTAFLMGIALLAAVALGFGLRAWTDDSSSSSASVVTPTHQTLNARDEAARRTVTAMRRQARATAMATATAAPRVVRGRNYR